MQKFKQNESHFYLLSMVTPDSLTRALMQGDAINKSSFGPAELSKLNTWSHTNWAWRNKLSSVSVANPLGGTMVWNINAKFAYNSQQ
jgi:hypothetical protein